MHFLDGMLEITILFVKVFFFFSFLLTALRGRPLHVLSILGNLILLKMIAKCLLGASSVPSPNLRLYYI